MHRSLSVICQFRPEVSNRPRDTGRCGGSGPGSRRCRSVSREAAAPPSHFSLRITIAGRSAPAGGGTLRLGRLFQVHVSRMMASPSGAEPGPTGKQRQIQWISRTAAPLHLQQPVMHHLALSRRHRPANPPAIAPPMTRPGHAHSHSGDQYDALASPARQKNASITTNQPSHALARQKARQDRGMKHRRPRNGCAAACSERGRSEVGLAVAPAASPAHAGRQRLPARLTG